MANLQTWEQAKLGRKAFHKETFEGHITDMIATHLERKAGDQAFLVEQNPHWITPTHFHLEHQFQVITAGNGTIGRHAVGPLCVHYAAPETAYGPIAAGPEGVSYLTMRMWGDTGAWYIHKPGSRERLQEGPKQGLKREQQHSAPQSHITPQALAHLPNTAIEVLIDPRADGLAAHLLRIAPGQSHPLLSAHAYGGRYYVVMQGTVMMADASAQTLSIAFATANEPLNLLAGAQGAEVLVVQFPVQALATA
jgi:hypothetical protein